MSEAFDIYTLLFLVLAVVIFIRLRNVLGRRTGNERPPYDPYTAPDAKRAGAPDANEPVVALPRGRSARGAGRDLRSVDGGHRGAAWPPRRQGQPARPIAHRLMRADPGFDPGAFPRRRQGRL